MKVPRVELVVQRARASNADEVTAQCEHERHARARRGRLRVGGIAAAWRGRRVVPPVEEKPVEAALRRAPPGMCEEEEERHVEGEEG